MFRYWKGKEYESGFFEEKKVLILGESHYIWDRINRPTLGEGFTIEHINEVISRERSFPFWRNIFYILSGKQIFEEGEKRNFLNKIAYYNYIKRAMSSVRERPTKADWLNAVEYYNQTIAELRPDIVIVCGLTMWGFISQEYRRKIVLENCELQKYLLLKSQGDHVYFAYGVRHPSRFFRKQVWRKNITAMVSYIELVNGEFHG